ncbi:MAG: hypothetical protein REI78_06470 [Pedobacter sp.]|nr:hypothetical protein [Pedobacter sp.]MDQ8052649.1 hypothetical protein [Pedobacter sp.]
MKRFIYIAILIASVVLGCTGSTEKQQTASDSALTAPVDTLGKDTAQRK